MKNQTRKHFRKVSKYLKKCAHVIKETVSRIKLAKLKPFLKRINLYGLFGGLTLCILAYLGMILQMKMSLVKATWIICIVGTAFVFGLAYSAYLRCIVLLILPQFFSKKGRTAIIGYAFLITVTGPGANTIRNTMVLSSCLTCGQEQLKTAAQELLDIIKKPLVAIKNMVKQILKALQKLLVKLKVILVDIKDKVAKICKRVYIWKAFKYARVYKAFNKLKHRLTSLTVKVIKSAFDWLGGNVSLCNKKVGTPFQRCIRAFDEAIEDCKVTMGAFQSVCNVTYIIQGLCYFLKFTDLICMALSFVSDAIVGTVKEKLDKFVKEIHDMFYVTVHFEHDFYFKTTSSKNFSTIGNDITAEIKSRTKNLSTIFNLVTLISTFFFLFIVFRALKYKHKYLTKDYFDNYFLTRDFFEIEAKRTEREMETLLPLTKLEKRKYIKITNKGLVKAERLRLLKAIVFMANTTIQLAYVMAIDFALYWMLFTIRRFGLKAKPFTNPPMVTLDVEGKGMLADLYEGIFEAFDPMTEEYTVDPLPCLPKPYRPNFTEYCEIGFYCFLCWLLLFFEPYGLRLRQLVMAKYYPYRSKQRAVWLYNNMLRKRTGFLKIARRMLRQKFVKNPSGVKEEKFGFLDVIRAYAAQNRFLRLIFGRGKGEYCMLCGKAFGKNDDVMRCQKPQCPGKYCPECFKELNNTCTICMEPMEYGDLSDVSEEKDSSDEDPCKHFNEIYIHCTRHLKRRRKKWRPRLFRNTEDDIECGKDETNGTKVNDKSVSSELEPGTEKIKTCHGGIDKTSDWNIPKTEAEKSEVRVIYMSDKKVESDEDEVPSTKAVSEKDEKEMAVDGVTGTENESIVDEPTTSPEIDREPAETSSPKYILCVFEVMHESDSDP